MRALPQSVPIMCGAEVGHPDASRPHQGDHFERRLEILCLAARSPMLREVFFLGHWQCSDPQACRRILAKDLARPYIAPQRRNGLVPRLTHDDELADAVHRGLGDAACPERMPAELLRLSIPPCRLHASEACRSNPCAGRAAKHDRIFERPGRPGLLESRPGRATGAARGPGKSRCSTQRASLLPFRRPPGLSSICGR